MADTTITTSGSTITTNTADITVDTGKADTPDTTTPAPKVEDLMAEIAQMKADMARNKNALDKALKEKGEITKKLREKQTLEEQEAELKAAQDAERAEREAEKDRIIAQYEARAQFAQMGLKGQELEDAISAKVEGDESKVYSIIVKHFETKYETALKTEKSEWLGNRPPVNVGVGSTSPLTQTDFNRMGYKERVELAEKHPELYDQFTKNIN